MKVHKQSNKTNSLSNFSLLIFMKHRLSFFSGSNIADKYHTNKIADIVASTGETVNIADAQQDPRIGKKVRQLPSRTKLRPTVFDASNSIEITPVKLPT